MDAIADKTKVLPVRTWTQEDFFEGTEPYEFVHQFYDDPFIHERQLSVMAKKAEVVGIRNFRTLYNKYLQSLKQAAAGVCIINNTNFYKQPVELDCGDWRADDAGVYRGAGREEELACPHPILPVERIVNIDTGLEKMRIAFSKGRRWRDVIVEKNTLASPREIVKLANTGVTVNSRTAPVLSDYFMDMETLNYDRLPERSAVSRLGWIEGEGFSPFVDGLVFDGDANYRPMFEAIQPHGDRNAWVQAAVEFRRESVEARIMLAASFASVLVKPLGALPFFVHLWSVGSSTGKTVALLVAASVWASPEMGKFAKTFNATDVGGERMAEFLNSLPMCIDELQLAKDCRGNTRFDVYKLAQGAGRNRGTKTGGIDRTPTWANAILTTGESPLTSISSGAGAVNRVIDVECVESHKVVQNGRDTIAKFRKNYGFCGREFVERLEQNGALSKAESIYNAAFDRLNTNDTTDKQAIPAALLVTADALATEWIFRDENALTAAEIAKFLATQATVSTGNRGYKYMCGWVAQNANKFRVENDQGEIYGTIEPESAPTGEDVAYIIKQVFDKAVSDAGFSPSALISYLKEHNLILYRAKNNTRGKRIKGVNTSCVALKLAGEEPPEQPIGLSDFSEL